MKKLESTWLALIGISIASYLGCLDLTIVNTALPAIQNTYQVSELSLQWVMNALLLALTAFMVVMGKLADQYGRRRLLYIGMIVFALASLGAGCANSLNMLVAFRFFQGVSIAILYTAPIAIVPALFPEQTGKAMGIVIAVSGAGLATGPALGGLITSLLSWHWIFFMNLPIILLAFAFSLKHLPESKAQTQDKIDLLGSILIVLALPLLIYTTVNIHHYGFMSLRTIGSYAMVVVLLGLFVAWENRVKSPIIDFHLFAKRRFIIGLVANFFLAFFYSVDFFFIPLYLHQTAYHSSYQIGLILLPATLLVAILSPVTGNLCDRIGPKKLLAFGYLMFVLSALFQLGLHTGSPLAVILIPYFLFGLGWALILSPSLVTALTSLPEEMGGAAMGSVGTWHNFGGAVGLALGSALGYFGAMKLIFLTSLIALSIIMIGLRKQPALSKA
ncbi:MAG: drug resistance transporter, drug antiporter-2 family [Gammaproteobacteria bacterium]|jgi:EmrB/QacA subfamily drug resistance transporter|nr:drug resistance transporter, drug antiporter-2 family [Gammaproteobacteria bacterium]